MVHKNSWVLGVTGLILVLTLAGGGLAAQAAGAPAAERFVSAWDASAWLGAEVDPRELPHWLFSKRLLQSITPEQYRDLVAGADPDAITTRGGEPLTRLVAALGQQTPFGDAVFTPLQPCRVIDTRVTAGKLAAGETRAYTLRGPTADYSAYGGTARGGCGIPDRVQLPPCGPGPCFVNGAQALVLNVMAMEPEDPGFLNLWAGNHPQPQGPRLAYASQPPNSDLANEVIVGMCDEVTNPFDPSFCELGDIRIAASGAPTHVVADVVGYFARAPVEEVQSVAQFDLTTEDLLLTSSCQRHQWLVVSLHAPLDSAGGKVFAEADLDCSIEHQQPAGDWLVVAITDLLSEGGAVCFPLNSADNASWTVGGQMPNTIYREPRHASREFDVEPGQQVILVVNAQMALGASPGDRCHDGRLRAVFYPN